MGKIKTSKQIERHFKGIANHYRIDILIFVDKNHNATVDDLAVGLNANFKTISEHTRRLVQAGLLNKSYKGRFVANSLSPYGKQVVRFIKLFQTIN
jgi:predicted transcriptional regulator